MERGLRLSPMIVEGVDKLAYLNGLMKFTGISLRKTIKELIKDTLEYVFKAKEMMEDILRHTLHGIHGFKMMKKNVYYVAK